MIGRTVSLWATSALNSILALKSDVNQSAFRDDQHSPR
jgi:hypothetical protein